MLEYSRILNVDVKKVVINSFWSISSVSKESGGAIAPPTPLVPMHMHVIFMDSWITNCFEILVLASDKVCM